MLSRALAALPLILALLLPATASAATADRDGDSMRAGTSKKEKPEAKKKKRGADAVDEDKLEVLARASTKFPCCEERVKNIRRIARLMNGVVVQPGESFSVNHFIGPRTEEKGFVKAPSILDLDYVETVGGGVSQFATTLYNALYDAGFPIIEHKPHSHYISRYPPGVEATLSWPGPDLSFKNDSEYPLLIKTTVSKDRVSVKLLGRTPGRKVERKAPIELERKSQPVEYVADEKVSPRKEKVEKKGSPRRAVQVRRTVTNPGKPPRKDEEVVVYLASKKVVRVHPCRLPKGHPDYTGEPCSKARGRSK